MAKNICIVVYSTNLGVSDDALEVEMEVEGAKSAVYASSFYCW